MASMRYEDDEVSEVQWRAVIIEELFHLLWCHVTDMATPKKNKHLQNSKKMNEYVEIEKGTPLILQTGFSFSDKIPSTTFPSTTYPSTIYAFHI